MAQLTNLSHQFLLTSIIFFCGACQSTSALEPEPGSSEVKWSVENKDIRACTTQPRQDNGNPFVVHTSLPSGQFAAGTLDIIDSEERFTFEIYCNESLKRITICNLGSNVQDDFEEVIRYGDPRVEVNLLPENQCTTGDYRWFRVQTTNNNPSTRVQYSILP